MKFASGKNALGICDRCGFTYKLLDLKEEFNNLNKTNILVCDTCWDEDHPQNLLGQIKLEDPQALFNPRPDSGRSASVSLNGWRPVLGEKVNLVLGELINGPS